MHGRRKCAQSFAWVVGLLLVALFVAPLSAADLYKVGDEIEVLFLGKWLPATVVEVGRRNEILAEFEFAATTKRQAFKAGDVRAAYESGAMARGRTWADPSGSFKIKAALLKIEGEAVLLRKEDKSEVKVPIAKLSTADQDYIKKLQKELGPAANRPAPPPEPEDFNTSSGTAAWSSWGAWGETAAGAKRTALTPDPMPSFAKLKQAGVAFEIDDHSDRLSCVLPIGGPDAWILAAVENDRGREALPGRLLWISLAKGKVENKQFFPDNERVLDYHPQSRQLLTQTTIKTEGDRFGRGRRALTLWKVAPTDKSLTVVARWFADDKDAWNEAWGRIVDATTVLHRNKKQEYVAWDIAKKEMKYKLPQESFFAPVPVLSGGRKYLILPEDKQVRVIEAATGALALTFPAENGASAVAVSEDGQRLAVLSRNELIVWSLSDGAAEPQKYQAEAIGTPFAATMDWVDSDHILTNSHGFAKSLYSFKHKIIVWNYNFDFEAVREEEDRRVRSIVDGHLVYAASVREGRARGLAVGAVKLPGPKVADATVNLDPETLLITKPGTEIAVNIQCGEYNERVWAAVQKAMNDNGWVLNQNSKIILTAEMKRGDQQTVTYQSRFGGGGSQTVTCVPFISTLTLAVGKNPFWTSGTSTGAPAMMMLRDGQSAQGEVDKMQRPNPEFFEGVKIPAKIMDPAKRGGLGSTKVTNRGLVPD